MYQSIYDRCAERMVRQYRLDWGKFLHKQVNYATMLRLAEGKFHYANISSVRTVFAIFLPSGKVQKFAIVTVSIVRSYLTSLSFPRNLFKHLIYNSPWCPTILAGQSYTAGWGGGLSVSSMIFTISCEQTSPSCAK